jgi:hypothetical protein
MSVKWSWEKPDPTPEEIARERARRLARKAARLIKLKTPHAVSRLGDLMDDEDPKVALAACALVLKAGGVVDAATEEEIEDRVEAKLHQLLADARNAVAGKANAIDVKALPAPDDDEEKH